MSALDFAKKLIPHGLSVLPVNPGVKVPDAKWKDWQSSIMALEDVESLFNGKEIGIICGQVSGGLECLDFDEPEAFDEWKSYVEDHDMGELLTSCYIQKTPSGGWHVVYRADKVQGNTKLAQAVIGRKARIETRGEGGYFKCYPSKGYQAKNRNLYDLPKLTPEQQSYFWTFAKFCCKAIKQKECGLATPGSDPDSPGNDFVKRESWDNILIPHGWTKAHTKGDITYWVRPGKKKKDGISASTGYKGDYLYVFSTSTQFDSERAYNKFAVYAFLNHGGNFTEAARTLHQNGFGKQDLSPKYHSEDQLRTNPNPPAVTGITVQQFDETFKEVEPEYLVEPYLRKGKAILLDADGGTGKTTIAAALAAWLSQGWSMMGSYNGPPVNTLYLHRHEDENDEIHTVFVRNGGDPKRIFYITREANWFPTKQGCIELERTIRELNIGNVVIDPLFSFLAALPNSRDLMKDQMAVYTALDPLMDVYAHTGAVGVHLRHTVKGQVDKAASELGMGSQGFRNRHRGQLVMRYHPDKEQYRGVVGLTDEKGSLLTYKGEPFFFRKTDQLQIEQILNITEDPWEKRQVTPGGEAQQRANDWLQNFLRGDVKYVRDVRNAAEQAGIGVSALYRAKQALGVEESSCSGLKTWIYDPFQTP